MGVGTGTGRRSGEGGGLSGDLTLSEQLFERYCERYGIPYQRVSATGARSPDYEMALAGQRIVVEVKEIEPNDNEKAAMERTARGLRRRLKRRAKDSRAF